jgi:hypothetical protein
VGAGKSTGEAGDTMNALLGEVDPAILHIANRPFSTPERLHRYAKMIANFYSNQEASDCDALQVPVLAVGARGDRVCRPEATEIVAGKLAQAEVLVLANGDHYSMYFDTDLQQAVLRFASRCDERRAQPRSHEALPNASLEVTP